MLQTNPEIEHIVAEATAIASNHSHEYVTLEHMLLAIIRYQPFKDLLLKFDTDCNAFEKDIEAYLANQEFLVVKDAEPRRTNALERDFNRALTQVLFSGRTHIQLMDLFVSMQAETTSYAHYFIIKYGLGKSKLVDLYNSSFSEEKSKKLSIEAKAEKVLEYYCTNLNKIASEGKIDSVIGRDY